MNVLITGGAGYIGTELIERLAAEDGVSKITIYDNLSRGNRNLFIGKDKLPNDKVQFVQGDLLDSRKLAKALQNVNCVYHLAANVTTPFSDQNPHLFEQVNHWGTAELIYALEESEVEQLVYVSSVSVYGTSTVALDTSSHLNPRTFYGISKMRAEEHVQRISEKMQTYIIRCGNVYGYNKSMRFDAVINRFLFEANFHARITINGTGEQHRPFVHIREVGEILANLRASNLKAGTYNLVNQNFAIGEVVKSLRLVYPKLEMLFVNQHMKMRELLVARSAEFDSFFETNSTLEEELLEFKRHFSF